MLKTALIAAALALAIVAAPRSASAMPVAGVSAPTSIEHVKTYRFKVRSHSTSRIRFRRR